MESRNIEVERLTVISARSFEAVVRTIDESIGRPDMVEFIKAGRHAKNYAELESVVKRSISPIGLMLFMKLDAGAVLRQESGGEAPHIIRFLIGNPLIMKEMTKHVTDAAAYAPITLLVSERPDGVHLSYDKVASALAPYGSAEATAVARDLDEKIEHLMRSAAG
jgi:uncharacterized protein (DUF302 family)